MAHTLAPYLEVIRHSLNAALCVQNYPSQDTAAVVLQPLTIARDENEKKMLCRKFARFFTQRAEHFVILRRKPIEGYDISFLITNTHLEEMMKERIVDFIIEFMEDIDKEIKDLKIALNTRRLGGLVVGAKEDKQ
ncbi:Actin-related protein 2/3 complex subunit 4 [Symbiodinium microadriaticum]|uniref:Actin-related protein 2/3 complex subunit 4 n=1 Tax=Symbiodinium microadriaticum TaxID=2951 RepID=A0A1Q9BZW6_SYMMI|nr:Actin-related protein 2/3 complex subunit 4 [Symbiodinium microadriaticum]